MTTTSAQKYESFSLELNEGIAQMRFCRPEKANSMSKSFWKEFPSCINELEKDPAVRVLIISGEGKNFSSGMDLSVFSDPSLLNSTDARSRDRLRGLILELQAAFSCLEKIRIPVIAAVQGACIGAALDLVSACDLRFAVSTAYFTIHEINLAMMADLGSLQRLPKWLPEGIVRELAYTGDRLAATRAESYGFINACFENETEMMRHVQTQAKKIASKSPLAIASSKEAITFARSHSVDEALLHTAILQTAILDLEDLAAAAKAQANKSEAKFKNRLPSAAL